MNRNTRLGGVVHLVAGCLVTIGLALPAMPSWAVLGGNLGSVANDQSRMRAMREVTHAPDGASVHEIRLADGASIRQFVNAQGIVYAVAWNTRLKPDFAQLLGRYASDFDAGAAAKARGHGIKRSAIVEHGDLVVQSAGRLNAFVGKAWLISQLPPGVNPNAIR